MTLTRPLLFRLGLAIVLSLAGYLRFRPRPPRLPPCFKDQLLFLNNVSPSSDFGLNKIECLSKMFNSSSSSPATTADVSPSSKSSMDDDGFPLPDFRRQEKILPMEQGIDYLRNLVDSLWERERTLEIQLLRYHGLKEQEGAGRELDNRLKVCATEARVLSLKVEMLQGENDRLREQALGFPRAVAEMESVRANIHVLQRKLTSDGEQAEGKISDLQQRLAVLQEKVGGDENLTRLKELENGAMELRIEKLKLMQENSELKLKLRSVQMPASGREAELSETTNCIRDENDKQKKDIEQLYNDRCTDVEELVYLRWINACLRYELRNYQPLPGKTVARDLSKNLSPQSERKAKQLIVEYADFGIDERNASFLLDFDSNYSSSQASNEDPSDSSFEAGSSTKTSNSRKSKFVSKFKKLILGKEHHNQKDSSENRALKSHAGSEKRGSVSPGSLDNGRRSNDSFSGEVVSVNESKGFESHVNERRQNKGSRSPRSLDIHRLRRLNLEEAKVGDSERCMSDVGISSGYERCLSGDVSFINLSLDSLLDLMDIDDPESLELRNLAEALRISRGSPKLKKRAASFSFT